MKILWCSLLIKGAIHSYPISLRGDSMELRLYRTLDNENIINKNLSLIHTMNIKLKDTVSITNPTLILSEVNGLDYFQCNYCFLSEFNRYYFIRDIELLNNKNYRMQLEVDVLESFKEDILNSYAEISRTIKQGDYMNINDVVDLRKEIDIYENEISLTNEKNIILSTIGG